MKLVFFALPLLFTLASSKFLDSYIVGGDDATIQQFPYMAGVMNFGWTSCGGSIINSRSVLTAAHCIFINVVGTVSVFVGSSMRRGEGGETYRALRVIMHPEYEHIPEPIFRLQNDVAIIRTIRQIQFGPVVQPVPLRFTNVGVGAQTTLTGWGLKGDSFYCDRAEQLQQLQMTSIPNLACSILHLGTTAEGAVTSEKLCVVAAGDSGGCGGDSGSPIVIQGEAVGIAAWTVRPCGSHPTVFIRISHHQAWIEANM